MWDVIVFIPSRELYPNLLVGFDYLNQYIDRLKTKEEKI